MFQTEDLRNKAENRAVVLSADFLSSATCKAF